LTPRGLIGAIIMFSLGHRFVVLSLATILAVVGALSLSGADYDVFPDFAPPQASIQTEAPGLAPEQIEALVTRQIETAIIAFPGLTALRSNSIQGLSDITVVFAAGTDVYRSRQLLSEALATLKGLPGGVQAPVLTPLTSSTGTALIAALTSDTVSQIELRTIADWVVRPRLLAIPGVADLAIYGGDVKQYEVDIDPARLAGFGLSLSDVSAAAQKALGIRGGGFIETTNQRVVIETSTDADVLASLSNTVVAQATGRRLTLGQVATITAAPEPSVGRALIAGKPGVQVRVVTQYGANTVKTAAGVTAELDKLAAELKPRGVMVRDDLFRPAGFIRIALSNLENALVIDGVLVIVVVVLFLLNFRMALIALLAIPLSLLAAVLALQQFGYSLNTMTLGGLGISVGLLVDDAVIVVENVYRRLRLAQAAAHPVDTLTLIAEATYETRSAVVFATLAIGMIFVPVLMIQDVAGRLFGPLGLAYLLATLASLSVALTVTPALCSLLIDPKRLPKGEPAPTRWLKARYSWLIGRLDPHLGLALAVVIGISAAVFSTVPLIGTSFIPELREGHYVIQTSLTPGSSLEASTSVGVKIIAALQRVPNVRLVSQRIGRAARATDVFGPFYSEFDVDLVTTDGPGQEAAEAGIREVLAQVPGASFAVKTFLSDRLDDVVSGYRAPLVVVVHGTDLAALDAAAIQIKQAVAALPGATDVQQLNPTGLPTLSITLRSDALVRWDFNPLDVLDGISAAFQGETVGQVYEGERIFNAVVRLNPALRAHPESVGALMLRAPDGTFVPLRELAGIAPTSGRYEVLHEGGQRVQIVTSATSEADIGAFTALVQKTVQALKLPAGMTVAVTGAAEAQSKSSRGLLINSTLAIAGMVLLLSLTVPRLRNLGLIFLNLPFALVGGILALLATGGVASLGALIGFVTLIGITLRNAIMMIAHWDQETTIEGRPWTLVVAIEGAADRSSPILMTTLATGLGLLPLALGSGEPGREIEGPMAIVILGGLISSAVLNLLVLPGVALRFGTFGYGTPQTVKLRDAQAPGE